MGLFSWLHLGLVCSVFFWLSADTAVAVPVSRPFADVATSQDGRFRSNERHLNRHHYKLLGAEVRRRQSIDGRQRDVRSAEDTPITSDTVESLKTQYIIVLELGTDVRTLNLTQIAFLKFAVASAISTPPKNVVIHNFQERKVEMYVTTSDSDSAESMVPASTVADNINLDYLNSLLPGYRVKQISLPVVDDKAAAVQPAESTPFYDEPYFPYIMGGVGVLLFALCAIISIYYCQKTKKKPATEPTEPMLTYPPINLRTSEYGSVQPSGSQMYAPVSRSQPVKVIKTKSLLERRGSNTSLTIDISQKSSKSSSTQWGASPPKESSTEEFLQSAGNRMSRKQLRNSVKNLKALHAEFMNIPENHPTKIAVPGSGVKNRYKDVLPNEHSRVVLLEINQDPLTTYINANYVRGYDFEDKAYIAAQGPLEHTLVDFWRMVWQTKSPVIVMITNLKERDKPKCEKYWPEDRQKYGEIEVSVDSIVKREGYVIRSFTVQYLEEIRELKHYWYTAWPDHKTPYTAKPLLEMVKEVERSRKNKRSEIVGPVCVHCSAGIGRTGCFIAISIGVQQLKEERSVDILGIVCQLRRDRGGMIQNNEQYEFVHQVLCLYEKNLPESGKE